MKEKLLSLLILSLLLVSSFQEEAEAQHESEVLVLGDSNLTSTLEKNDFVFLQFYAPWCGHCKQLAPEYQKLPALVKHLNVVVGKIDTTKQTQSGQKYEIQGFPTLKFSSKGRLIDYSGARTAKQIASWIQNVVSVKIETISEQLAAQKAKGDQVIIIRTKKAGDIETMRIASVSDQTTQYYAVESDAESVTLYLKGQQPIKYDGQISVQALKSWIIRQTLPTIIELSSQGAINYVFSENKNDLVIIIQFSEEFDSAAKSNIEKFCQENEQNFVCTICKPSDTIYQGVAGFFKIEDQSKNLLTYIKSGYASAFIATFTPQTATYQTLKQWKASIEEGKQQNVVKAQEQANQIHYENVVSLSGQNFDTFISENPFTFMQFYATFCGHCKSFAPVYDKFAKQMIDAGSEFKIAAVNCQQEQQLCQKHSIQGYPTLKLFYHGVAIDYEGGRNGESIKAFIDKIRDSKPITVKSLADVKRPASVIFDPAEVTSLTKVSALYFRYPVYHIREADSIKVEYLGEQQSEDSVYTGQISDKKVAAWLRESSKPILVDFRVRQIDPDVTDAISAGSPLMIFFINHDEDHQNAIYQLKKYCKGAKEEVVCGFAQKGKGLYDSIIDWLNLMTRDQDKNYLMWINTTTIDYFIYDKKANQATTDSIQDFITRIKNNEIGKEQTADEDDSGDNDSQQEDGDQEDNQQKGSDGQQDTQDDDQKNDVQDGQDQTGEEKEGDQQL